MTSFTLLEALSSISDAYIDEAARRPGRFRRYLAIAVSCALVAGAAAFGFAIPRMGANDSASPGGANAGVMEFMQYAGPILPLTATESAPDVAVCREITLDFALSAGETAPPYAIGVTDGYVLRNTSAAEQTLTLAYPFESSYFRLQMPVLSVDGQRIHADVCTGRSKAELASYEDYRRLLADGGDLQDALGAYDVPSLPVTVYAFTDSTAPPVEDGAPTLAISGSSDPEKTQILTYGINGASFDGTQWRYDYFIPRHEAPSGQTLLIVLGEDLEGYTLQGYADGNCEPGKELDGVSARVTRYETTLDRVLRSLTEEHLSRYGIGQPLPEEELSRAVWEGLAADRTEITENFGRLDDALQNTLARTRIFYLTWEVTIPAYGSRSVCLESQKEPSSNYAFGGGDDVKRYGYDLCLRLGSSLFFEQVTASLKNPGALELLRQNFGFDPVAKTHPVSLDPAVDHYYLEVCYPEDTAAPQ